MPAGQLLWNVLGSLIGDQTPQKNPNFVGVGPNGEWINGETPYAKPGFGTKFFNPNVAAYEAQQNNAAYNQFLATEIARKAAAREAGIVNPALHETDPTKWSPEQTAIFTGGNPTASNINAAATATGELGVGLPAEQARQRVASTISARRESEAGLRTNLPESLAGSKLAESEYSRASAPYRMQLLEPETNIRLHEIGARNRIIDPETELRLGQIGSQESLLEPETSLRLGQIGMEKRLMPSSESAQFARNTAEALQSKLGSKIAEGDISNLPSTLAARRNAAILGEYESQRGQPATAPFGPMVTGNGVTPLAPNPSFAGPLAIARAMTTGQGIGMNGGGLTTPTGKAVTLPDGTPITPKNVAWQSSLAPATETLSSGGRIPMNMQIAESQGISPTEVKPVNLGGERLGTETKTEEKKSSSTTTPDDFLKTISTNPGFQGGFMGFGVSKPGTPDSSAALDTVAEYLSHTIQVPKERVGYVGSSIFKRSTQSYFKDALMGRGDIDPKQLLQNVPSNILDAALKKGGYKK